jgi:hypothetical protein
VRSDDVSDGPTDKGRQPVLISKSALAKGLKYLKHRFLRQVFSIDDRLHSHECYQIGRPPKSGDQLFLSRSIAAANSASE